MLHEQEDKSIFGEVIDSYSRAQALEDGFLVDVSEVAREAGIKFPVALTRPVYDSFVEIPEGVECQDESGRLWDILWMFRHAIKTSDGGSIILFNLQVRNDNKRPKRVTLKAVFGPGDNFEPVITIMLPDED